jgi:CBS-domain-containing membrane protein
MSTTVAAIMNPKLLYIREGDRLSLARAQILKFGVTAVPVLDELHRPVGVVSLRDLAGEDRRASASVPAKTVCGDASLEDGARVLVEAGVHHLVVVDRAGIAIGMVSALDLVRAFVGAPPHHPEPFARY